MTEINKFVNLFHTVQGVTLKEKKRNFNEFLRLLKSNITNEEDLNILIRSINPKTPIEETFKLDLMIEFKQKQLLLQEFKGCKRIFVKKLLKNWRLFGEIFSEITAEELVNNILSHLPYTLRLKVLNGISKNITNENQLDEYFLMLEKKYGMNSASIILPGCSGKLLRSRIEKYHLTLSAVHLKRIFKKDPEFIDFYFDVLQKNDCKIDLTHTYRMTLKYVARVNPDIYWKLQEKYKLALIFGKYLTPKMVKSHKNIIGEGYTALDRFHFLKMYKTLLKEEKLEEFLLNLWPESHDEFIRKIFDYRISKLIKQGPSWKRYSLISEQFNRKYDRDLLNYPDYFTEDLLKITPLKERESILDLKVKDNDDLYYLYGTEISVPKFKQRMQHSSKSTTRFEYASDILRSCLVNNDYSTLLEILRHITIRYKNDGKFLLSFFQRCLQDVKSLKKFSIDHWECLCVIQKILEQSGNYTYLIETFYQMYLTQLLVNDKPCDHIVKDIVKRIANGETYGFIFITDKRYQKIYCDKLASFIDHYTEHERYQYLCCQFLQLVNQHCNFKPEEFLEYSRFFDQLKIEEWVSATIVKSQIKVDNEILHDLFWKLDKYGTNDTLMWYARNRPDLLQKNADKIWNIMESRKIEKFLSVFKRFCNDDILETIKEQALETLNGGKIVKIEQAIAILSVISPQTFLELLPSSFPPADGKIDMEKSSDNIKVQRAFVNGLRNIGNPSETFPLVLKFCIGDYLKFALSSLYSISYNTSEEVVEEYIKGLSNTAMSVKKHILFLARHLFPSQDFKDLLKEWSEKEENVSMRNIIFKKTMQYFIENPAEDLWILLKHNLKSIDPDDREIFDYIMKFQNIPLDYIPEYIERVYEAISQNPDPKIKEKRFELIATIPDKIINGLNIEFLKELIKEIVCSESRLNFHWKCVFYVSEEKQSELFEENFFHLKKYVEMHVENYTSNSKIRSRILIFLSNFLYLVVEVKSEGHLINRFISSWSSMFAVEDFGKDFMLVEFYEVALKCDFDTRLIGSKMNRLLYHYIDKYSSSVIGSFCQQLQRLLTLMRVHGREDYFHFVEGLFEDKKDENIYIAVLYFLPRTYPTIDTPNAIYLPIIQEILNFESSAIKFHFDYYLGGNLLMGRNINDFS